MDQPKLLSVVAIGPQKTATSWLHEALRINPQLSFPLQVKETFFWDRYYDRGIDWYFSHFPSNGRFIEIAPTYFHNLEARDRLYDHNAKIKVIITLRDPAERAFSLFLHHRRKGRTGDDFWQAAEAFPEIIEASRYGTYIGAWETAFGSNQILMLMPEEIERQPLKVLDRVSTFIGVRPHQVPPDQLAKPVNVGGDGGSRRLAWWGTQAAEFFRRKGFHGIVNTGKSLGLKTLFYGRPGRPSLALSNDDRAKLQNLFSDDIRFVETRLNTDLPAWRNGGQS